MEAAFLRAGPASVAPFEAKQIAIALEAAVLTDLQTQT
jgi:hypothetical protein